MSAARSTLDARIAEKQKSKDFIDQTLADASESGRKLSEAELRQLDSHKEIIEALDTEITHLSRFLEVAESGVEIDKRIGTVGRAPQRRAEQQQVQLGGGEEFRSFGQIYTESEQFETRGYMASVSDDSIDVTRLALETRAVLTTTAAPGSGFLPKPERYQVPMPELLTPLLDMITKVAVTTGSVDVLTWGLITGVDEVTEGAAKPELSVPTSTAPLALKTVAGWVKYTRQLAEDVPEFADFLSRGITRDLLRKLQSIVGAAIAAAALPSTTGLAGEPLIEVIRQGIATVEAAGFSPNVLIGSPAAIASLDIAVLNLGGAAATVMGRGQWGLTPVAVPGFAKVVVADAADAFTLFTRSGVRIYTTDSDITGAGSTAASDFRSNILTTLGETRANAAVTQPNAATQIVVTPEG